MATTTVATKKRRAWTTSVFIKQLMAVSGFVFVFFLLFHSYGNLKMFLGEQVYN
ncbi:MAG: succinate dehydrogenase, partial [Schaalia georgiae]|nr:succinate dehydrogenase [Schaalia georgiae]